MPVTTPTYYGTQPMNYTVPNSQPYISQQVPMVQSQPQPQTQPQTIFMTIENEDAVSAYPLAPMCTAYLLTKDEKLLFKKSADEYGRIQSIRKYQLAQEDEKPISVEEPKVNTKNFATKDQLKNYVKQKDYDELLELIGNLKDEIDNLKTVDNTDGKAGR